MQVVGVSTQHEVWVASATRKLRINELLLLEDPALGLPIGQVVETQSLNRLIPLAGADTQVIEPRVREGLTAVGFDLAAEALYLGRVRLLEELDFPVEVGTTARTPSFAEAQKYLVSCDPGEGLVLGVIRGTEELTAQLPPAWQKMAYLFQAGQGFLPQAGVPYLFHYYAWDRFPHLGIFGGSGSGKSFALRVILEELLQKQVPVVVFDPHYEMSLASPAGGFPGQVPEILLWSARAFVLGQEVGVRFEELTDQDLASLLEAAGGSWSEAMDNTLKSLHQPRDSYLSFAARVSDLIDWLENPREARPVLEEKYGPGSREITLLESIARQVNSSSTPKGISWRLNRLYQEGIFTGNAAAVVDALARRQLAVVQGPIWLLRVFAAYLLRQVYRRRRAYMDARQKGLSLTEPFPPFVVALDEAHNFAPKAWESPTKSVLREIAQEGRKYGVFLILATQRPALLDDTITAQLNTKMIFRTVRSADLATIKEETDLGPAEMERLPYLPSGECFISSAITGRSIPVRIRAAMTSSPYARSPFNELAEDFSPANDPVRQAILALLPLDTARLNQQLAAVTEQAGRPVSFDEARQALQEMAAAGLVVEEKMPLGRRYHRAEGGN